MNTTMNLGIDIETAGSIHQIGAAEWNHLSASLPFQSHRWYTFGEKVMVDTGCEPIYLLARQDGRLIGRASFWVVSNEPLPYYVGRWRAILRPVLRKYPLLICRSPLANLSGLVLENGARRQDVASLFMETAFAIGRQRKCLALILDYLRQDDKALLPASFLFDDVIDPGTIMHNRWVDFGDYLATRGRENRKHYRRILRKADEIKIDITQHNHIGDQSLDDILSLIHATERHHRAPENPWHAGMFLNMEMVDGVLLTARVGERLVGCDLLLGDGNAQMATALGHVDGLPYVYLRLTYECIRVALENGVGLLRWGSGAYELKRRLGFDLEDNAVIAFVFTLPIMQKLISFAFKDKVFTRPMA